jgi:hypothetical protein
VADGDGLENHCGGNATVGSNPTPSARPRKTCAELGLCPPISRSVLVAAVDYPPGRPPAMGLVQGGARGRLPE